MRGIEEFVVNTQSEHLGPFLDPQPCRMLWDPKQSPRSADVSDSNRQKMAGSWFEYSGSNDHYAIIGPSRQPYRHKLVGAS